MEINDLIIFKTVASEGSISKAAKELGYVQPNITERIKKLEQELETPLLHRDNKGVSLLPSGDILLDYTNQILTLVEEAKDKIKTSGSSYIIATSQSILTNYVSKRIKENFRSYQIYVENSSHLQNYCSNKKLIWSLLMRITQTYRSKSIFHFNFYRLIKTERKVYH